MASSIKIYTILFWSFVFSFILPAEGFTKEFTLPFERVTVTMSMDDSGWVIGHEKVSTGFTLIEWVPESETVENWSSQFRALRLPSITVPNSDARILAQYFVDTLLPDHCKNEDAVHYEILESDTSSALIAWQLENCESEFPFSFDQRELTRFIVGREFTFNLAFTRNLEMGLRQEYGRTMFDEDAQLAALRSAVIQESKTSDSMAVANAELMKIPMYQVYAQFDDPSDGFGRLWLEEIERKGTGRTTTVKYRIKSKGLPPEHWYAIYIVNSPEGLAMPVQYGLIVGEDNELVCSPDLEEVTPVKSVTGKNFEESSFAKALPCAEMPNRNINDSLSIEISDFQAGLAVAVAVQSHDASHRYLATAIPRPLKAGDAGCEIGLELVSPDGKTYLLRGHGFESRESLHCSWKYAKNTSELVVPVNSDGSFIIPLFHSGEAKGRRKWRAEFHAIGGNCGPKIEYFWGKDGMKK